MTSKNPFHKKNIYVGRTNVQNELASTTLSYKQQKDNQVLINEKMNRLKAVIPVRSIMKMFSNEEMKKIGKQVTIKSDDLTALNGINDPRLGSVDLNKLCQGCNQIDCPGHYGYLPFGDYLIPNPVTIRQVVAVLRSICNSCGELLVPETLLRDQGIMSISPSKRLFAIEKASLGVDCVARKAEISGGPTTICSKNPDFSTDNLRDKGIFTIKDGKTLIQYSIVDVYRTLDNISPKSAAVLGFTHGAHPRDFIMKGILIIPPVARPHASDGMKIRHDNLTLWYKDLVSLVIGTKKTENPANAIYNRIKNIYYNSDKEKINQQEVIPLTARIQGKEALIRENLMSKRGNYSGRAVADPGIQLDFDEAGIPAIWASSLTKQVKVTERNYRYILDLMKNDQVMNIISGTSGITRVFIKDKGYKLRIGDIVERKLQNGDRIGINRQPTLHKTSFMGYRAKLIEGNTITIHLSCTSPMNCDFDGDEINVWVCRDEEVEAEFQELVGVKKNIMSTEQNRPNMGLVMDSVTAVYLLSSPKTMIDDRLFEYLLSLLTNQDSIPTLYQRLKKYGVHPRSGHALLSALMPIDFCYLFKDVEIYEGVVMPWSRLTKAHVGNAHKSIIQEMVRQYGNDRTGDFFTDASLVSTKWIMETGFSVGIPDMITLVKGPDGVEYNAGERLAKEELNKLTVQLKALGEARTDPSEENVRRKRVQNLLNAATGTGLKFTRDYITDENSLGVMIDRGSGAKNGEKGSGAKGSVANTSQMVVHTGQQYYGGKPVQSPGEMPYLPSVTPGSTDPRDNGFVTESFTKGLDPAGLYFIQIAGREGILDTALKTARTGNMQRRLVKSLENITIFSDGSIRNSIGVLFTPCYGSGHSVDKMVNTPYGSSFIDLESVVNKCNSKRGWVKPGEKSKIVENRKKYSGFTETVLPNGKYSLNVPAKKKYSLKDKVVPEQPSKKLNKYERARIIGTRARLLSNNITPIVPVPDDSFDPVEIATREYYTGNLDLYILRKYPDGRVEEVQPTLQNI